MKRHNVMLERKWKKQGTITFAAVGLISAYLTFKGLRGVTELDNAVLLTFGGFIFQMTMWGILIDSVGKVSRRRRGLVELAAVVTIVGVVVTSTLFAWTGMAGPPSQTLHMDRTLDRAEQSLDALRDAHRNEQQLAPMFAQTADSLARVSGAERNHGALSGRPSRGPISTSIDGVSASYLDVARMLEDKVKPSEQRFGRIEELLKQMRELHNEAVAADPAAVREISKRFAGKTMELNDLFDGISTTLPTLLVVVRQSDAAIEAIPTAGAVSPSTTVASLVAETKRNVETLAKDVESIETPSFKPLSQSEAAWQYLPELPSFAVYCLFFDLVLPLAVLLAALIFGPPRKEEYAAEAFGEANPVNTLKKKRPVDHPHRRLDLEPADANGNARANGMSNRERLHQLLEHGSTAEKRAP